MCISQWLNEHFNLLKLVRRLPCMSVKGIPLTEALIKSIDDDTLQIIFHQAEKKVESTFAEADIMYSRSATIATASIAALSGLIGYMIAHPTFSALTLSCGLTIIVLVIVLCVIKDNLIPDIYKGAGSEPTFSFNEDIYKDNPALLNKSAKWRLLYNQASNYQNSIQCNVKKNKIRSKAIEKSMKIIYIIPLMLIIIFILSLLLQHCRG